MRKMSVDRLKTGTKIAKSIYIPNRNQPLIGKDVIIKPEYISRLKTMGINSIYVEDDFSKGIEIPELIPETLFIEAKVVASDVMQKMLMCKQVSDVSNVNKVVNKMIDEILNTKDIIINLTDIKVADDYTFAHSVNVCVLSLIVGMSLQYNDIQLRDLGTGALLHDIGKLSVPVEILNKPDKLTDEEFQVIKKHTLEGFNILRQCNTLNRNSVFVAYGHHEKFDGSGYPQGLKGKQTHEFARIVCIADVFDAMTSDRVYRKGIEPHKVIKHLIEMSNSYFDYEIVKKFIKNVLLYPPGSAVVLSTGEKAIVVKSDKSFPDRPIVRVLFDSNGKQYDSFYEKDLAKESDIWITQTFEL